MSAEFRIEGLGVQGDGVAATERGPVYIPFTLAGERVTASRNGDRADLLAVIESSPLRVEAGTTLRERPVDPVDAYGLLKRVDGVEVTRSLHHHLTLDFHHPFGAAPAGPLPRVRDRDVFDVLGDNLPGLPVDLLPLVLQRFVAVVCRRRSSECDAGGGEGPVHD